MKSVTLIGHPVAHSRSPKMMNAAFAALGLDAEYTLTDTPGERLGATLRALFEKGYAGANVTLPHKVAAMPHLASNDLAARAIGAVNTLVRGPRGFVGHNTDADAVVDTLRAHGAVIEGADVVVIGSGGAARAAAIGLARANVASVTVIARDRDAALSLATSVGVVALHVESAWTRLKREDSAAALAAASVVIQATSCGMQGGPPDDDILKGADLTRCAPGTVAFDLVYVPEETRWMREAARCGLDVIERGGTEMLVRQGAAALKLWFGVEAPVEVMRAALTSR